MKEEYKVKPIGNVKANQGSFALQLNKEFIPALKGIEEYGYIKVLWWPHLFDTNEHREIKTCDKPYTKGPDKIGVFATRSPIRPNPIAITPVAVLSVDLENGIINIPYIDAENDSPILDIKPYHPCIDRIKEAKVPVWCQHWPNWYEESADFNWEAEFNF